MSKQFSIRHGSIIRAKEEYSQDEMAEWLKTARAEQEWRETHTPEHGQRGHRFSRDCDQCIENGS